MMKNFMKKAKEVSKEVGAKAKEVSKDVTEKAKVVQSSVSTGVNNMQDKSLLNETAEPVERTWTAVECRDELERCQKLIDEYEMTNPGVLKLGLRRSNTNPGISLTGVIKLVNNKIIVPDFVTGIVKFGDWNNDDDIQIELGSGITNLSEIFSKSSFKNLDLSNWDITKYKTVRNLFVKAKIKNLKGLGNWDMTKHTELQHMFRSAQIDSIDGINDWDVSNIQEIRFMFSDAKITNLDISNWKLKSLQTTPNTSDSFGKSCLVFRDAEITVFGGLEKWDMSKVTCLIGWFHGAKIDNLDLSAWDVSNVTNMSFLFEKFVGKLNLSNWNVSKVENMIKMFNGIKTSGQLDINNWNVSKVKNMAKLFSYSACPDLDLSNWNVSSVTNMESIFDNCKISSVGELTNWNVSNVTDFSFGFRAVNFESIGEIGRWNVKNCDVTQMFGKALITKEIGSISGWTNNLHQEHMFQRSNMNRQ